MRIGAAGSCMAGECSGSRRRPSIQCRAATAALPTGAAGARACEGDRGGQLTLLPDELRAVEERFPVEVVDGDAMTFSEWEARSNTLARALVDGGVESGDRVMILLPPELADRFG